MNGLPTPALVFGGLSHQQMVENRTFLEPLPEGAAAPESADFRSSRPAFAPLHTLATWGGLLLEALIALLCVIPAGGRIQLARHAALLAFCVTTYALAPVAGFGWLIATMGLAHCRANQPRVARRVHRGLCAHLLYSEIPWAAVLAEWTGR